VIATEDAHAASSCGGGGRLRWLVASSRKLIAAAARDSQRQFEVEATRDGGLGRRFAVIAYSTGRRRLVAAA